MHHKISLVLLPVAAVSLVACGSAGNNNKRTVAAAPAASTSIDISGNEYAFSAQKLKVQAGKVKVTLHNTGKLVHEIVFLKTASPADGLKVGTGGRVSEKSSVGEVSETKPGGTHSGTVDLTPGTYVYVCNLPGHYKLGMHGTLTVE